LGALIAERLHNAGSPLPDEFRSALPAIVSDSDFDEDVHR
jgi:hypothetical protein